MNRRTSRNTDPNPLAKCLWRIMRPSLSYAHHITSTFLPNRILHHPGEDSLQVHWDYEIVATVDESSQSQLHLPENITVWNVCFCKSSKQFIYASNLNHESSYVALQFSFNPSFNFFKNRCELILLDLCSNAMGSSFIDTNLWSLRSKVWMSAWKRVSLCLNLLTVLCTDAAISTGGDPRGLDSEGTSGIHGQLVSANFKGVSKFVSYLRSCPYHLFDARWRDLEIPGWLTLNQIIINQCSRCFQDPINDLTVVAYD